MSRHTPSRYIFEITENERIFRHQPFINDLSRDCPSCYSRVGANEPYKHHWMGMEGKDAQHIQLSLQEKLLLKRIEKERIETFLLCDESPVAKTSDFLLAAGTEALPHLLRFLSYETNRLDVTIGMYVNIAKERMYYESCPVTITHYLDIEETVDMILCVLVERIRCYVMKTKRFSMDAWSVKRMKVIVKRSWHAHSPQPLPLQYRIKNDAHSTGGGSNNWKPIDLALLTESYLKYRQERFGEFPATLEVNLYTLRVCALTKELYAVPYLLSSEDVSNTPTFLIQTDVTGEFQGMHEIRNIRKFVKPDSKDNILECRECKVHFTDRTQFALHKQIDCGRGFLASHLDQESIELYENCLPLPREYFQFAWFGIIN